MVNDIDSVLWDVKRENLKGLLIDVRSWVTWWQKVYTRTDMTSWVVALGAFEKSRYFDMISS